MSDENKLQELKARLIEVDDLGTAASVLNWDQSTYMPPGGAAARARQLATLSKLAHQKFTSDEVGQLLDDLAPLAEGDSDDAAMLRVTRRNYDQQVKIPTALIASFTEHAGMTYDAWTRARPANDFATLRPLLERTKDFSLELAECFPGYEHVADPLIDMSDYGMKASSVRTVFAALRDQLVPLVESITAQPPADESPIRQYFPENEQLAFGLRVIKDYGFDFQRGRQDKTHHPFMTKFAIGDVRITTRVREDDLGDALFSTLHEAGHAMYELGMNPAYDGLPLAHGTSAGVHESQSRLWENIVGRSRTFWEHYYPQLQEVFPVQLGNVSLDAFYRAINSVKRSLIRTDADEVTYNLHVLLRFELELQMLEGALEVRHLPEAWQESYETSLGIAAPSDVDGVLQDVHWYGGLIGGAFQGYTLGNILSALFYDQALKAHPSIPQEIGQGKFDTLHGWLKTNIYQHGSKYTTSELVQRITGGSLTIDPYMAYLREKYGELYPV